MAKIQLMPGIERISGSIGDTTFRTVNGKTFVHRKAERALPVNASRKAKALYKRRMIVNECVCIVQSKMDDMLYAIHQRNKIRDRLEYLYDKNYRQIKARTKLQRAMLESYWERNGSETARECLGNGSVKKGKNICAKKTK